MLIYQCICYRLFISERHYRKHTAQCYDPLGRSIALSHPVLVAKL